MKVPVNLHTVKGIEAIPPGTYSVRVEAVNSKESKTHKPMAEIKLQCTDEGLNNKLFTNIMLDGTADWKWKEFFEATGAPFDEHGFDTDDLVGTECKVTVDIEVYEGKTKNQVGKFLKI